MLKYGNEYVDPGTNYYEQRYQNRILKNLKRKARELGYDLVLKQELTPEVT